MILRGYIAILPPERTSVSYEQLAQLVVDYLLAVSPGVDLSVALSAMPVTRKGMDLNPVFTDITAFHPAGLDGGLKLFHHAGIQLVHGWLADPSTREYEVLKRIQDYDSCVNLIAEADHISRGQLLQNEQEASAPGAAPTHQRSSSLTPDEQQKLEDALIIRSFLENTSSQLTYHGLFALASKVQPGSLVALFRNSHLSVLYKSPDPNDSALYTLATDQVFANESSVVWERLEDVDGGWSSFVDSDFKRATPAGGDYAGHTGETALAALEHNVEAMTLEERADYELAQQLQRQEDEEAHQMEARRRQQAAEREQQERLEAMRQEAQENAKKQRKSKKGDCIIM